MRAWSALLVVSACFSPVVEGGMSRVTQCRGTGCLAGECCEPPECDERDPLCALERYRCGRPCTAYEGVTARHLPACSDAGTTYCVEFDHMTQLGVRCESGALKSVRCDKTLSDGGSATTHRNCDVCPQRRRYCVSGGDGCPRADGGSSDAG